MGLIAIFPCPDDGVLRWRVARTLPSTDDTDEHGENGRSRMVRVSLNRPRKWREIVSRETLICLLTAAFVLAVIFGSVIYARYFSAAEF